MRATAQSPSLDAEYTPYGYSPAAGGAFYYWVLCGTSLQTGVWNGIYSEMILSTGNLEYPARPA